MPLKLLHLNENSRLGLLANLELVRPGPTRIRPGPVDISILHKPKSDTGSLHYVLLNNIKYPYPLISVQKYCTYMLVSV